MKAVGIVMLGLLPVAFTVYMVETSDWQTAVLLWGGIFLLIGWIVIAIRLIDR